MTKRSYWIVSSVRILPPFFFLLLSLSLSRSLVHYRPFQSLLSYFPVPRSPHRPIVYNVCSTSQRWFHTFLRPSVRASRRYENSEQTLTVLAVPTGITIILYTYSVFEIHKETDASFLVHCTSRYNV